MISKTQSIQTPNIIINKDFFFKKHLNYFTSLVNLHRTVAHPSCIIPFDPKNTSYIHFPKVKKKRFSIKSFQKYIVYIVR